MNIRNQKNKSSLHDVIRPVGTILMYLIYSIIIDSIINADWSSEDSLKIFVCLFGGLLLHKYLFAIHVEICEDKRLFNIFLQLASLSPIKFDDVLYVYTEYFPAIRNTPCGYDIIIVTCTGKRIVVDSIYDSSNSLSYVVKIRSQKLADTIGCELLPILENTKYISSPYRYKIVVWFENVYVVRVNKWILGLFSFVILALSIFIVYQYVDWDNFFESCLSIFLILYTFRLIH